MTKSHQTFRKRQRERAVRDKAQRKRERREQRKIEKKDFPFGDSDPFAVDLAPTEADLPPEYETESDTLPPTDN